MGLVVATSSGGRVQLPDAPAPASADLSREATVAIVVAVVVLVVVAVPVALFTFGEDLFGSDPGTIDSYNREVLESCRVPEGARLVRVYTSPLQDLSGSRYRSMSFVFASPSGASELAGELDVPSGYEVMASEARACRFGNHPAVWVTDLDLVDEATDELHDSFWGGPDAEIESEWPIPESSRSLVRLRLAQQDREGIVD